MPGISPTPSSPRITHTVTVRVLSLSILSRSFAHNALSNLVVAFPLKSSRTFSPNVTNLGATITMILGIRGVMIPIDLVSSTMDSIGQSVVLFKPVPVQTSDPKSEFLCQLSLLCAEPADPPESTLYTWDISHTLVTTYHPYCHSPSALTEYLKQKLHQQRAKRLSHSLPTQVESSVSLERNINSDFTLAATTLDYLDQRGECNVPKRYLKEADWCKDGTLGAGYYIAGLDNPAILILVDFNFKYLQWGCTHPKKDKFILERPAPTRYRLCIFDEERT